MQTPASANKSMVLENPLLGSASKTDGAVMVLVRSAFSDPFDPVILLPSVSLAVVIVQIAQTL